MNFLFLLLFCAQLVQSNPFPISWMKDVATFWGSSSLTDRNSRVRRDDQMYIALLKDPNNEQKTQELRTFINGKVSDKTKTIIELRNRNKKIEAWGQLTLSDSAKAEVEAQDGIDGPLDLDRPMEGERAIFADKRSPRSFGILYNGIEKGFSMMKRALTWGKQEKAGKDLVMDSTPSDLDSKQLTDFVFEENAGKGVFIYVMDGGVQTKVKNNNDDDDETKNQEFDAQTLIALQTETSKKQKQNEDDDSKPDSHGTLVAAKALGRKYGVAKGATLVSIKIPINPTSSAYLEGLSMIADHIQGDDSDSSDTDGGLRKRAEGNGLKSVVCISIGTSDPIDPNKVRNAPLGKLINQRLGRIFGEGTPMVLASGNYGKREGRQNIDSFPMVMESPTQPIINVGAVDYDGKRADFSQGGRQLTIYAPGVDVETQTKEDKKPIMAKGTSIAAPQVAGIIATYLGYPEPPWDKTKQGNARVQAIKEYIKTDASSWVRTDGERVVWNGATKDARDNIGASCSANQRRDGEDDCSGQSPPESEPEPEPEPEPQTNEPEECSEEDGSMFYANRDEIEPAIDEFCQYTQDQGGLDPDTAHILHKVYETYPEELTFTLSYEPGLDLPTKPECVEQMKIVMDGCDRKSNHWKRGGKRVDTDYTYEFYPTMERKVPIEEASVWGGCVSADGSRYYIWGAGWAGADEGKKLKDAIDESTPGVSHPTSHGFSYGGGDDNREWKYDFTTIIGQRKTIESVMEEVAGWGMDVRCD